MNPFEAMKFAELDELPRVAPKPKKERQKRGANPHPKGKVAKVPAEGSGVTAEPRAANWKVPAYQHSTAMRDALARAKLVQPSLVSISNTPVRGDE